MMFKGSSSQGDLNGFLDAGSHMNGELRFEDTFRIEGSFKGSIVSKGDLIVGENGEIEADVRVRSVYVAGKVGGTLSANERIELAKTAKVRADLSAPSLSIEDGAFFEGRCAMDRQPKEAPDTAADRQKVAKMPIAKKR